MNNPYLILTPLDKQYFLSEDSTFLGDWCVDLSDKNDLVMREKSVGYHWLDREKYRKDYDFLSILNEEALEKLSSFLNSYHDKQYSKKFWRILIGPWLLTYVSVIWERWEAIKKYLNENGNHFHTSIISTGSHPPKNFENFRQLLDDDFWNHEIFSRILLHIFPDNEFSKVKFPTLSSKKLYQSKTNLSFKSYIFFCINLFEKKVNFLLNKANFSQDIFLYETNIPFNILAGIMFKLRKFPFSNFLFRKELDLNIKTDRGSLSLSKDEKQSNFESFFYENILNDIPIAYLEGFSKIESFSRNLPSAKKIVTSNAYWYNEIFKLWSANLVEKGSKLIILEHGGGFKLSRDMMNHLENIANVNTSWGKEFSNHYKRLPPNKSFHVRKLPFNQNDQITFFDYENVRYGYRAAGGPTGPAYLEEHYEKIKFINLLTPEIKKQIKIKPKYLGSWNPEKSYIKHFGNGIISKFNSIENLIDNSKLIICGYPQTTLSQGIFSNVPTILIFKEELWEIHEIYTDLIRHFKDTKIIHTCAESASNHLIEINDDILEWWNSESTIQARKHYGDICNTISKKPISEWSVFLKNY